MSTEDKNLKVQTVIQIYIKIHLLFIFRVKGIDGLRVADGSVMRHLTSGNTNAPCIMIGEKAADLIKGQDTVEDFRKKIKHLNI